MIKCDFESEVLEKALPIFEKSLEIGDNKVREELYNLFKDISEQMKITGSADIDYALGVIKNSVMSIFEETLQLDDNDIRAALTLWKHGVIPEDTTADHLLKDNEKLERVNEDPFETYYLFAMNAKIRAKLLANKVGIRSILYNENGIINSTNQLNESIRDRQEELLKNVINYLRERIPQEMQLEHPEIFSNERMYINNKYTGIVEKILELYSSILGSLNFNPRILNKYYNDENYKVLDTYNSWIILNNFDTILQQIFGKAISINPDMAKFTVRNKYAVAGGSNVYSTWRTSDEIDMGKEINNITQAIVTSIPFIPYGSTTPSQNTVKFNEFLYIISKIKNLVQTADNDWNILFGTNTNFSEDFVKKYSGKSFLGLINSIRTNPQEILPDIFKLLNNNNIINGLIGAKVIESNTFLNVDLALINSLYEGLFNEDNQNSLLSILNKSGFDNINYFAFIGQTIDSAFKSSYLQYFRNPLGEIFIRNMYDLSISNIEYAIKDTINSINSKMLEQNYDELKYDVKTENRTFSEGLSNTIYYNDRNYTLTQKNSLIVAIDDKGNLVYNSLLLENLIKTFTETPDNIVFTIKNFHKGPLKVTVSLNKDLVTYEVNGLLFNSFTSKKDFESLSDFVLEVLLQNLNIDNAYLDAYKGKFKYGAEAGIISELMRTASRVIANKHLSNTILKDLNPLQIKYKLNQIFGKEKSSIKPTVNKLLGEIDVITDSDTKTISNLAEAKALATGRLTSSQVIDSNGNAVASSSLSRLLSTYSYQINEQASTDGAAAQGFSLWNTGVFKGIRLMKEILDNSEDSSKSSTEFSNAEMEYATVFIDFIQSLLDKPINDKTPIQKGLCSFIPSENSDKTYIGRMLIDLAKLKIGEENIYDILRNNPTRIYELVPTLAKELNNFYTKAKENIDNEWRKILIPEGYSATNLKDLNGKIKIKNSNLLNSILVSKDGYNLFQMNSGARIFVLANINGKIIPFYKSSLGTDGKVKGAWYPFFGMTGNWLVKGSGVSTGTNGEMNYTPEIDKVTKILNENLDIPFLNINGEFLDDKNDSIENYGFSKYFFKDMFDYNPQEDINPGLWNIPNHPMKNGVKGYLDEENKMADAIYVESITGIDASNVGGKTEDGWISGHDFILLLISEIGSGVSYGNWGVLALKALNEGKSTLQYINDIVTKYNNENPNNPIVLIDLVHYVADKNGSLSVNESFLENTKRFKNSSNINSFLHEQNLEVVKQLLKDRLRIPVTLEIQVKMNEWKASGWNNASKWIDERTGEMILAKVYEYNPVLGEREFVSNIRRPNDLSLLEEINDSVSNVEINPILESYNILNYFFTLEFMNSTVGAFYAHPNKKAKNIQQLLLEGKINKRLAKQMILDDEKARKLALDKRNVSFTAAMHSFLKGLILGIPDEINIAIMDDPKDYLSTIGGKTFDIKPFDGCTFECPFFGELENASLGGAKVGVNKKTFTHYYDARTGTGGIIKTANFPLTNDRIRGSKFYQRMMKNMTDRVWKNQNGTDFIIKNGYWDFDETRLNEVFWENTGSLLDYNGNQISFTNPNDINGELYFKLGGEYFKILSIEYLGNNTFKRYLLKVNKQGRPFDENDNPTEMFEEEPQIVNTNYKLWNLFGGAYSMELSEGNTNLLFTENSIKIVANIINRIGTDPNDKTGQTPAKGIIRTQADIYQPLKHSDIHLMPTIGAVKLGAGNINGKDKYNISDPNLINFMKVKMNLAGVLLDKEHHADDEDLSIMTLVISACAARGYTHEQLQLMLNALASLAKAGIKDYLEAFNEFFRNPDDYSYEEDSNGDTYEIESNGNLNKKQKTPKLDKNGNPISNSLNYLQVILNTLVDALVHSTNSAATLQMVTQELINKAKEGKEIAFKDANTIPYSDPAIFRKLHSTIAVALTRGAIKIKVQGVLSVLCPSFGVVKLYNDKTLNSFDSDEDILNLQAVFDSIKENNLVNNIGKLKLGRTYKIKDSAGNILLLDVRTLDDYYRLKNLLISTPENIVSIIELFAPMPELGFEGGRELASYNATFKSLNDTSIIYNINDLASVHRLSNLRKQEASAEEIDLALLDVQKDLMTLHNKKGNIILDNGTEIQVDPKSVDIEPYEIVMPKIFASTFGLEIGDDLLTIKSDKEFFVKRLINSIKPKVSNLFYSIGLMNIGNRNSIYILDRNQGVLNTNDNFILKEILQITEKGKTWRVRNGEKLYQMLKGDTVYEYRNPDGTILEIIVSSKPEFYILNCSYTTLACSNNYDKNHFMNILGLNRKISAVNSYFEAIENARTIYGDSYENAIYNLLNIGISDLDESPVGQYFKTRGHELHTSFLLSLKVVAARIPAQSMLSFMPMKVVAFEAPDINTAYVSTAQFLFLGSDLDIDAVSLASFSFDKSGRYILHSPYSNMETEENLEASMEIPFPTGKVLEINSEKTFDYSRFISYAETKGMPLPFVAIRGNNKLKLKLTNPYNIRNFARFIEYCNRIGYIPASQDKSLEPVIEQIKNIVNKHNDYINSDKAEDFSKNYVVSTMYKIGLSPANLIESLLALDSITEPLKDVANNTIKALEQSLENPANFTTNIHGIALNMAGKKGVGICAVGLKSFFAATARYNEVLRNGTEWEQERLKSEAIIAGRKYQMLANAYGTNISNQAIAEVVSNLSNLDLALTLSALLSLATDNAKELALDKLNASNMLGMYIYGITIGVDFLTLANIICSETGLIINEMMKGNSFLKERGKNIQNIFDYLELAPTLDANVKLSDEGNNILGKLDLQELFNLTHKGLTIEELLEYLDKLKYEIDSTVLHESETLLQEYHELHRLVEQAEDYILRYNKVDWDIYNDFKKLNEGAEELRRLGQLLHINQGLENSYAKSLNYINTVTSVITDRLYSIFRETKREKYKKALIAEELFPNVKPSENNWNFEFHLFVSDKDYREAWIDIYDGKCNRELFGKSLTYRNQFAQVYPYIRLSKTMDEAYKKAIKNLKPSRVFFNVLDILQVPHFAAYLESADMLHQAMMKTSVKYRSIFNLGQKAIDNLGAHSTNDKESIYRRTEQMVDRIIRDRYYLSKGLEFNIPRGSAYFIKVNDKLVKKTKSNSSNPIQLGTEEGNASFKLFMESVVIPNLLKGKYGDGNNIDLALAKNEFIKSLSPTLYKHNAYYNVTICYAPGINMSPRSDAEKALFEKIKYDFNAFRSGTLSHVKYKIKHTVFENGQPVEKLEMSIPELFYYYNQIAFGGRPGENTMTSIFLDILDYRPIKEYRDYENALDMEGVIEVEDFILNKETALRLNPWSSNMLNIYYEDPDTGNLAYWTKTLGVRGEGSEQIKLVNGYNPSILNNDIDSKNYINISADKISKTLVLSDGEKIKIEIDKGKITKVIRKDKSELKIPDFAKPFFDNPLIKVLIQPNGSKQLVYDTEGIKDGIEDLIKCYN